MVLRALCRKQVLHVALYSTVSVHDRCSNPACGEFGGHYCIEAEISPFVPNDATGFNKHPKPRLLADGRNHPGGQLNRQKCMAFTVQGIEYALKNICEV